MRAFSFLAAPGLTLWVAAVAVSADAVRWEPSFEAAMHKAAQQNRPVLIHFWNDGCPPCETVDRRVFPDPQVAHAVHQNFVPVKVHATRRADLAQRFGVRQWPTDVIVAPNGQVIAHTVSPQAPGDYLHMVHQIAAREQGRMAPPADALAQGAGNPPPGRDERASTFPGTPFPAGRASYETRSGGAFPLASHQNGSAPNPQNDYASPFRGAAASAFPAQQQPPGFPGQQPPAFGGQPPAHASPYGGLAAHGDREPHRPGGLGAPQNVGPRPTDFNSTFQANHQHHEAAAGGEAHPASAPPAGSRAASWPSPATPANPFLAASSNAPAQVGQPPQAPSGGAFPPPAGAAPPSAPTTPPPQAPQAEPKFALDGYCVVSLVEQLHLPREQQSWRRGDPRWGAVHRGQTYLFAGPEEQQRFLANPDYYTPILSGYDPVAFVEQGALTPGRREFGFTHEGKIYLFASEQNLQRFWASRDMYLARVHQAMNDPAGQQRR